jgi:hypothetical protein
MKKDLNSLIKKVVKEEMSNLLPGGHHDHEAKMAKSELRGMIEHGAEIYKMIQDGENLPGWISGYITLASDYMHSVYGYMKENKN